MCSIQALPLVKPDSLYSSPAIGADIHVHFILRIRGRTQVCPSVIIFDSVNMVNLAFWEHSRHIQESKAVSKIMLFVDEVSHIAVFCEMSGFLPFSPSLPPPSIGKVSGFGIIVKKFLEAFLGQLGHKIRLPEILYFVSLKTSAELSPVLPCPDGAFLLPFLAALYPDATLESPRLTSTIINST